MSNNTFGYIRKRILDALGEYTDDSLFISVSDTDIDALEKRIPSAVSSALIRMYESLPIGLERGAFVPQELIPVTYAKSIPEEGVKFETDISDAAAVFFFSGKGSLTVTNEKDEVCCEISCDGSGRLERRAEPLTLSGTSFCVKTTDFLSVKDFTLYERKEGADTDAYAPCGFTSICLPPDFLRFEELEAGGHRLDVQSAVICGHYAHIPAASERSKGAISALYRKKPPVISSDTQENFVFDLTPIAVEALIYLSASELCRQDDTQRYSRLVYKYTDLCAGICRPSRPYRNTFFKKSFRVRWR